MKPIFFLFIHLSLSPLFGQIPLTRPPAAFHPNAMPPNTDVPPYPNSPNPYDPYGSRAGQVGSAFSEANGAAIHFLNIVDNQVYAGAWLDAGGVMHDVVPQKVWAAGMRAVRMHLGNVRARTVGSHSRTNSLPGGLQGEFMIIHFNTEFSRRPNSVETVTLMLHAPIGIWKVISYNIGP